MEGIRFKVEFLDQDVLDQFKSLPKSAQQMIKTAIEERLEVDPISFGKPLQRSWRGHRRMRVSSYRIIYRIEKEANIVVIVAVDNRKDIYEE
jgi:mRNA interferase RelE/StbE